MKITITTTVFDKGIKTQKTENVQKNDLRIEILSSYKTLSSTYNILDCLFDYECSNTKHGFRITKTIVQHKVTKHTTIQNIFYN
jgi:hypothetical protein